VLQLGSGALLSTSVAFALELVLGLGLLVAVAGALALRPGGLEMIQATVENLQDPAWLQEPANLIPLVSTPPVLGGVFLLLAGIVPLVEEGVKTLGVAFLAYQRPGQARAFLWGVAGGAGFALAENLFNTTNELGSWAPLVLLRVGASLLHCATGGLMGLAWYRVLVRRQWGQGLGLFAASIAFHGVWNALAAVMALASLWSLGGAAEADLALAGLGSVMVLGLLIALSLGAGLGLLALTLYLRRNLPVLAEGEDANPSAPGHLTTGGRSGEAVQM
jgi:hypothetical protein